MKNLYRQALDECATGNLRMTQDSDGHQLFCYTKSCFFGKDTWNEITKSHRGQLYYENKPVNKPFKKIFNVDEVPETDHSLICERMKKEPYEILDKANGHLFIVSLFKDSKGEQHVVFSTKGSLPNPDNDLLNNDIKIFNALYGEKMDLLCNKMPYLTLMFEAIVSHDQHSMYELQVKQYGSENCFVLLGASVGLGYVFDESKCITKSSIYHSAYNKTTLEEDPWVECNWEILSSIANIIGCPVVQIYDELEGTPKMWKDHSDREGYVIHFLTNNDRVKIKTTEYWQNRFKKDLTPEAILSTFKSGGFDKIKDKLPEEIANKCISTIYDCFWFWHNNLLIDSKKVFDYGKDHDFKLTPKQRKWIFTESDFSQYERIYLMMLADNKDVDDLLNKKNYREMFYDWAIDNDFVCNILKEVVYNAL